MSVGSRSRCRSRAGCCAPAIRKLGWKRIASVLTPAAAGIGRCWRHFRPGSGCSSAGCRQPSREPSRLRFQSAALKGNISVMTFSAGSRDQGRQGDEDGHVARPSAIGVSTMSRSCFVGSVRGCCCAHSARGAGASMSGRCTRQRRPVHAQALAAGTRSDEYLQIQQQVGETTMCDSNTKRSAGHFPVQASKCSGRSCLLALFVLLICASSALAQNRTPCSSNRECTGAQQCRAYSSSSYVDCNAMGRLFGCTRDTGMCGLFCSSEALWALRCTSSCTRNAQCQAAERCARTPASGGYCVRR